MEELDPWAAMPNVGTEVVADIEFYKAETLAGKTYITPEMWKAVGWDIPYIDKGSWLATQVAVTELLEQGLPCYVNYGGEWAPALASYSETQAVVDEINALKLEDAAEEAYWNKNPNRLKSVSDMLLTPEIDWMVEDKIHRTGLFQLYGESYAGKTVLTIDLVMSWCAGLSHWQGYRLNNGGKPQEALYIAAEGGAAVSVHVDAWLKYYKVEPSQLAGLYFLDGGDGDHAFLSISSKKKRKDEEDIPYQDSFARLFKEVVAKGVNPSFVIFDTQIDIAPGVDEQSNTDMVGILRDIKRMADKAGFMAMVIHHTGHDGKKARGASGMMGKCDVQAKLSKISDGKAKLEWTKVKGRAKPKDTISYHIQGWEDIPNLDSEGAVCIPITPKEATRSLINTENSMGGQIIKILSYERKKMSGRDIAEKLNVSHNNGKFKEMIKALLDGEEIIHSGEGRSSAYEIAPHTHRDEEY